MPQRLQSLTSYREAQAIDLLSNGNVVQGNYLGTDLSGEAGIGNYIGVQAEGDNNTIGGTSQTIGGPVNGPMNLISGNLPGNPARRQWKSGRGRLHRHGRQW